MFLGFDPHARLPQDPISVGTKAPDFKTTLANGKEVSLTQLLEHGPIIINFIRGTWCTFCSAHLQRLARWQSQIRKNITTLIVSTESRDAIIEWKRKTGATYLFASDETQAILKSFETELTASESMSPLTLLIDTNRVVRMVHYEKRGKKLYNKLDEQVQGEVQEQVA